MIASIVQITLNSADLSLFADFSEDESSERRMFRGVGKMTMDDQRGRIDVALEPALTAGWSRTAQSGFVDLGERAVEAGIVLPAALFQRVEQAFFSARRYRLVLTASIRRDHAEAKRGHITACSVLFNPEP